MNKRSGKHGVVSIDLSPTAGRALLFIALAALIGAHWFIAKWGFANMASTRADQPEIADLAVGLAPSDPQTHFAAAVVYNKTFLPADQERSLAEFEKAVALSPNNYLLWLDYGSALERNGDRDRASLALKKAIDLAPNYAAVQWAFGNLLIRKGDVDPGFEYIRKAVEGDANYAGSAAFFAYQYFDGNLLRTRSVAGDSPRANAALALLLAKQKRFDEAADVWQTAAAAGTDGSLAASGRSLVNELISAKKFALALKVAGSIDAGDGAVTPEKIYDGGFEHGIKLENASPFEWHIGSGQQPQVLQSTGQVHGGSRSLVLRFNSNDGSGMRSVSQTVVLRPNTRYSLNGYYRSDLNSDGKLVWLVTDAADGAVLVEVPLGKSGEWRQFSAAFQVHADTEAVVFEVLLKPCGSALCPANGSVWLDDLSLNSV